jgi:putative acetyltransferase
MSEHVEVTVRPATPDDFEAWLCLYEPVAAEGMWIGGEAPVDRAARRRSFDANLMDPDSTTFLAEVEGQLVGTLGVQVHRGIADLGMMVDADWRGRGVGSALMEACTRFAIEHRAHKLTLEGWPHATAARRLYGKFGFEPEGLLVRHYRRRNGELWDAIKMGLVLDHDSPGSPHHPSSPM